MPILTTADLESYMSQEFTDAQTTQADFIIDYVNQFIEDESGVLFESATGAVVRCRADCDGEIDFGNVPVSAVTLIHDYRTNTDMASGTWYFDGIDLLCGFYPYQVVDVTLNYTANASASVYGVALAMASRCMQQIVSNQRTDLKIKQVGDVLYEFAEALALQPNEQAVLDRYSVTETTWKLDVSHRNRNSTYNDYPVWPDISSEWF